MAALLMKSTPYPDGIGGSRSGGGRSPSRGWPPLLLAVAAVLLLGTPGPGEAQRLNFHTYSNDAGLPQSQVLALHQDRHGFLWFGTYAGVGRYNGRSFRTFASADGLPGNVVNAIAELPDGRIVVATGGGGVCVLEGEEARCLTREQGPGRPGTADVLHLAVDPEGRIWTGGAGGLGWGDPDGPIRPVAVNEEAPGDPVTALLAHPDGSVWVSTANALHRAPVGGTPFVALAGEAGETLATPVRFLLPLPTAWQEVAGEDGAVLAGTDGALYLVGPSGSVRRLPESDPPPGSVFRSGQIDAWGTGWFATSSGLLRIEDGEPHWIGTDHGLPWTDLGAVHVDREGNVWLGGDLGMARLVPGPFVGYGEAEGLPGPFLRALGRTQAGVVWAGTRLGVAAWEPDPVRPGGSFKTRGGRFVPVIAPEALPDPRVYALAPSPEGGMLVGTGDGLVHHRQGVLSVHGRGAASPGGWVGALLPSPDGSVWVATRQGVGRWREGELQGFPEGHPLADVFATSLLLDGEGRIWVGTVAGGLFVMAHAEDPEPLRMGASQGLTDQVVWDLALDRDGSVWVASNGDGVFRVPSRLDASSPGSIERLGPAEGLPDPFAWQVHVDATGSLWVYTGRGLAQRSPDGTLRSFGVADGLPSLEGTAGAVLEFEDGSLWFGTGGGAVVYDPAADDRTPIPPPVIIEEVRLDGAPLPAAALAEATTARRGPELHAGLLQFRVAALTFRNPQGVRFRYRLLRDEREIIPWSVPSGDPSLTLAGLGAGSYQLEVTALAAGGIESEVPARFPFTIRPAFWQTPGFVVLAMVAFILLLVGLNRIRSGAMEEERRRLEGLVRARTSELQNANDRLREEVDVRERAEGALLESEGRLRDIIENSTNVFYAHTPLHEITYISPQCKQVFGHDPDVFPEVWTTLATDHPANERGIAITERALETGERQPPYELQLRHADGRPIWVRVTEAPVVRNGTVVGMVGSLTDVTEPRALEEARQGLEERLREARKMEAVGRLAGGIAHDFNNLLTSILGHTSLMAMELAENHPLQHDLAEVADSCNRAAALVAQLLAVGRRQLMQPAPFHVHAALEERARMLTRVVGDTVEVCTRLEGEDPRVVMDPSQFDQVVLNLVLNARDAMPAGGEIRLQVSSRIWTSPPPGWEDPDFRPGDFAELVCTDTGTGMPPEVMERIFEPFFTTKDVGEGTGLGLSTVWGIIRQNHGHLQVSSTPGEGTTFRIWIPANPDRDPTPEAEAREPASGDGGENPD